MTLTFESAVDIAAGVRSGEYDPVDVVEAFLDRIERRGDVTNAFVTVLEDDARARAQTIRDRIQAGDGAELPLAGVPVAMKDLPETKAGVPNTKGVKPLADNVAEETSVTIRRLEAAGAVIVGTTNTPELGYTARTTNLLQGPTATPFDPDRNAGGSSGGSAAALGDGLCALATGTDVGGSLRVPAACCGVASVKPSHGLVPRGNRTNGFRGHTPVACTGPMARDVESLAVMLDVMAGRDRIDPFSVPTSDDYHAAVEAAPDVSELTLAYSSDLGFFAVEQSVRDAVGATVSKLETAGATVHEVSLDVSDGDELARTFGFSTAVFFATAVAELEASLGIDLTAEDAEVPDELQKLVSRGESYDITDYTRGDFLRTELYHAVEDALSGYDAMICPTLATPPLTHDEPLPTEIDGEPTSGLPMDWILTWPFNMTGHPVVNVPAEQIDGLPMGMQLVGEPFSEGRLLGVAAAVEETAPWSYPDSDGLL